MIWLLRDFDLLAVLLHAATLSLEALVVGGVAFLLLTADFAEAAVDRTACRRLLFWSALAMAAAEAASMAVSAAMLLSEPGAAARDLVSALFLRVQIVTIAVSLMVAGVVRTRRTAWWMLPFALVMVTSTVWLSHAVSRMEHRVVLALWTGLHHLGTASWVGAMPYLLLSLRSEQTAEASREMIVRRFSRLAFVSVASLLVAGVALALTYVGTTQGLYGTAYGWMLLAKIYLTLLMLALGAANWSLHRGGGSLSSPIVGRIRRYSEVEIGLGFTVLLAAASLTAQPPAVDVGLQDQVAASAFHERMAPQIGPQWPRFKSPPLAALAAPTPMAQAIQDQQFNGVAPSDANDRAWSEYNHHWAGLIVFCAGVLALCSRFRGMRWARFWPLAFLGLAAFILLRADPEAWPLGPRPFWDTFSSPDVLEHRLYALLIAAFAAFECAVQAGWLRVRWAAFVFPGVCALGAGVLLTHGHASGNMQDEVLADASHTLVALFGATAGWARWLSLRVPEGRMHRIAGYLWPVALICAALVLVDYREA